MASVKVFGSPTSAEVARVLTCLFEKDVEFQLIRIENFKGQEKRPDYLKFQPSGQSLTFEDGDKTLVDSREICRHISRKYAWKGNKDLFGSGALERAAIEQWLQTEAHSFDPPSSALVFHLAFAPTMGLESSEAVVEESKHKLSQVLDMYEQRLEESEYLALNDFTLADLSHIPNIHKIITSKKCEQLLPLIYKKKRVSKWWEAISSRSSWRKVVEMQQEVPPMA